MFPRARDGNSTLIGLMGLINTDFYTRPADVATEISGNQSNQSNQCQKNNLWQDFAFFPPFPLPFRQYSVPLHPTLLENEALCFDLVARNLVNFNL